MPEPHSDTLRTRAVELGRTMGARGVAAQLAKEGLGTVGKSAVAEWLRADRARRAGAATGKAANSRTAAPTGAKKPAKGKAAPEHADDEEDAPTGEAGLPGGLAEIDPSELDFAELQKLDRQVGRFLREAYRERDERRFVVLGRFKVELRTALNKLRPIPQVDPATDPASLEARAMVLKRLEQMVKNAKGIEPAAAPEA